QISCPPDGRAMSREGLEVADVFRHFGPAFRDQHGAALSGARRRAMIAIESCRTAALGGHVERCGECGHQRIAYDSCRNRNCPKCQGLARAQWIADRQAELLDVPYFHVVFTVPTEIEAIAIQNIWAQRSASSAYYTRGDKTCYTTRTFIFSSLGVASRLTANVGLPAGRVSFCQSECCRRCSGASSCTTWRRPSALKS